jgi:hypothetical protein
LIFWKVPKAIVCILFHPPHPSIHQGAFIHGHSFIFQIIVPGTKFDRRQAIGSFIRRHVATFVPGGYQELTEMEGPRKTVTMLSWSNLVPGGYFTLPQARRNPHIRHRRHEDLLLGSCLHYRARMGIRCRCRWEFSSEAWEEKNNYSSK